MKHIHTIAFLIFARLASTEENSYCTPNEICDSNSPRVSWVSSSPLRNSFSILFSCLATFFACAWSILQLNLPGLHETATHKFFRKVKWMIITIVFPELLAAIALIEFGLARQSRKEIRLLPGSHSWTTTHGFFANMGGFVLRTPGLQDFPLNAESLRVVVADGPIQIPDVEKEDIKDRSKSDVFARSFAVLQGCWTVVQCIARYREDLPIMALEVNAALFTIVSLWTYAFEWSKPKDVSVPIVLVSEERLNEEAIGKISNIYKEWYGKDVGETLAIERIPFGPLFSAYFGNTLQMEGWMGFLIFGLSLVTGFYNGAHMWVHENLFNPGLLFIGLGGFWWFVM
ncbi:SE-domain-containing protein [Penicillium lividum]|nr:SE-domain-containing protein [Penicillium lividum]